MQVKTWFQNRRAKWRRLKQDGSSSGANDKNAEEDFNTNRASDDDSVDEISPNEQAQQPSTTDHIPGIQKTTLESKSVDDNRTVGMITMRSSAMDVTTHTDVKTEAYPSYEHATVVSHRDMNNNNGVVNIQGIRSPTIDVVKQPENQQVKNEPYSSTPYDHSSVASQRDVNGNNAMLRSQNTYASDFHRPTNGYHQNAVADQQYHHMQNAHPSYYHQTPLLQDYSSEHHEYLTQPLNNRVGHYTQQVSANNSNNSAQLLPLQPYDQSGTLQ